LSVVESPGKGRPTVMTESIKKEIIDRMEAGEYLAAIVRDDHMPNYSTVTRSFHSDPDFCTNYQKARSIGIDKRFDELEEYAEKAVGDPKAAAAYKLVVDTRKWVLSKQAPKKYGDKIETVLKTVDDNGDEKGIDFRTLPNEELLKLVGR